MHRGLATILAAVAVVAAACSDADQTSVPTTVPATAPPTTAAALDEPVVDDGGLSALLPPGVRFDPDVGGELAVRRWSTLVPGELGAADLVAGSLRVSLPGPDAPVRERAMTSAGTTAFERPQVGHVDVGRGRAKVIETADGEVVGMLVAAPGVVAVVLDVDGDTGADVVDVLRFDPPSRLLVLTDAGATYDREVATGALACPSTGLAGGVDPRARLVLDCGSASGEAALGPSGAGPGSVGRSGPIRRQGADIVEVVVTAQEAVEAVSGGGGRPSAEARADADRLMVDLERYGAGVVTGALVNDALTAVLPTEVVEAAAWLAEATGLDEAITDDDLARQATRSTDDLLSAATVEILLLGEDDTDGESGDEAGGSTGLCTSDQANADGSCRDDAGSGSSWGDPHLVTYDGLAYDLQAVGEFVLTRAGELEVQVRYGPYRDSDRVSVTTAVGARIGGATLTVEHPGDGRASAVVVLDGVVLDPGADVGLPDGGRVRRGEAEVLVVAGDGSTLGIDVRAAYLNVRVRPADGLAPSGLLGDRDGDRTNDLATPDGPLDTAAPSAADLYGRFADTWRVVDGASLLPYDDGETTATFTDRSFPAGPATLDDVSPARRSAARVLCRAAGVLAGDELGGCVLDVALTGDEDFARGAARLAGPPEADPLAQRLRAPDTWVSVLPGGWADEVVEAPGAHKDPAWALGPRDASGVPIGAGDTTCAAPFVVRFTDVLLTDGPGPDLAVFQLGVGEQEYEVWVGAPGAWRRAGYGVGPSAFDLAGVLAPGESVDHVRICDPPIELDGPERAGSQGPSIDAVAVLGTPTPVVAR
ncbi:MAG TPA: VWD domain-containing protein [Acidimicrobiales bacterium]|nr:VWD domain-containing protein [Acidimicrobiales bacterium]